MLKLSKGENIINNEKEGDMGKATKPFKDISSQRVGSLITIMASIFMIFYTPSIEIFKIGSISFTHNLLGMLIFLIASFYFLKTLEV